MNIEQLDQKLKNLGIPKDLYNFDDAGREDERFCIKEKNGIWNVYYKERGEKTTDEYFNSEEEACNFLLKLLL